MLMIQLKHAWFATAFALAWRLVSAVASDGGAAGTKESSWIGTRNVREIITTTACPSIGMASDYPARLDLIYVYSVEYYDVLDDLAGIERAIATSVASALNTCGTATKNQPLYAVELSDFSEHRLIPTTGTYVRSGQSQYEHNASYCCTFPNFVTDLFGLLLASSSMSRREWHLQKSNQRRRGYSMQLSAWCDVYSLGEWRCSGDGFSDLHTH
jgi:hypothetical protein